MPDEAFERSPPRFPAQQMPWVKPADAVAPRAQPAIGLFSGSTDPNIYRSEYEALGNPRTRPLPVDFRPVDHDPFADAVLATGEPHNVTYVPVEHDPFVEAAGEH